MDKMLINLKGVVPEDFVNYKKPSLYLIFPNCSFKCDKECGRPVCQNLPLVNEPIRQIDMDWLIQFYLNNPITKAIVCAGLEPFDSFDELAALVRKFRKVSSDDFVIYTGYMKEEIEEKILKLKELSPKGKIIIKFGRYIPNQESHYDEVLGVKLASPNQFSEII